MKQSFEKAVRNAERHMRMILRYKILVGGIKRKLLHQCTRHTLRSCSYYIYLFFFMFINKINMKV